MIESEDGYWIIPEVGPGGTFYNSIKCIMYNIVPAIPSIDKYMANGWPSFKILTIVIIKYTAGRYYKRFLYNKKLTLITIV